MGRGKIGSKVEFSKSLEALLRNGPYLLASKLTSQAMPMSQSNPELLMLFVSGELENSTGEHMVRATLSPSALFN